MSNTKSEETENKKEDSRIRDELLHLFCRLVFITGILVCLYIGVFGVFRCGDDSMSPGIGEADLLVVYRLDKNFFQNDLTCFVHESEVQVRRVIAVGGDTVNIGERGLEVNGSLRYEPGIREETLAYEEGISFPITLKKDEVFLLADSRDNAVDSRLYGPVKKSETKGIVTLVIRHRGL